jgi:hypothetical protein
MGKRCFIGLECFCGRKIAIYGRSQKAKGKN